MRILVSGFEPFLDEKVNPSALIAQHVNSCDFHTLVPGGSALDVRGVILPVTFDGAFKRLKSEMDHFRPDVVVCFGLAGGRTTIDIERVAINIRGGDQTSRGDNQGNTPSGPVIQGAPLALVTTLPFDLILDELKKRGVPAKLSFSAGTYVCNDLFFQLQNELRFTKIQSGFIHIPRLNIEPSASEAQPIKSKTPPPPSDQKWTWPQFQKTTEAVLSALANKN